MEGTEEWWLTLPHVVVVVVVRWWQQLSVCNKCEGGGRCGAGEGTMEAAEGGGDGDVKEAGDVMIVKYGDWQ